MVPSLLCVTVQGRGRRRATERCTEEEKRRRLPLPLLEAAPPRLWLPGNGVVAVGDCSQSCCSTSIILPFTVNFMGLHVKIEVVAEPSEFSAGIEAAVRSIWKLLLCRSILFTTICGCCRDPYGCLRISMVAAN
ncbi:uncharacterized protein LOC107626020 isoform X1 [Arachis ipaensis]|uniref:uncharacterized protein LOC107626020 isoform X1 n=1 Tax=Arachis ipaensis TaxID=130454 RepID=UPI0007AFCBCA|nr:uncharacterized protein LOC107626020 isoform X1 [Arachis ipaensis]XP_020972035.1 uncharacterized protein LOC107626020 isoform X1 [Arachis ipaensis]XP_020972036.1 uncharacterized protein LOC107626020 isoform X1 [Arachis ipaensis]